MKLRILGNSIRLRLGRGEAARLLEEGWVVETTNFGSSRRLEYELRVAGDDPLPHATFEACRIVVSISDAIARAWVTGNEVGISGQEEVDGDGEHHALRILIEKDYECLNVRTDEDQADAFPNPLFGTPCPDPRAD